MRIKSVILLLLFYSSIQAQKHGQAWIDSLLSALPNSINDTVKAKILNKVALYYSESNTDSAFKYAAMGMQLTTKMKWYKGIGAFNTCYGNTYIVKGQLDSALYWDLRALEVYKKINDSVNIGSAYNNLGAVSQAKSDFVSAAHYYMLTLEIGKGLQNNYDIGVACDNLALVCEQEHNNEKGLEYARQALNSFELINSQTDFAFPLELIGTFFLRLKQNDSAYYYYQKSLAYARINGNKTNEGAVLNSLAGYYAGLEDYTNAVKYGSAAKKIWDILGPEFEDAINNTGLLGSYYLQLYKQLQKGKVNYTNQISHNREKLLQLANNYLKEAVEKSRAKGNKNSQSEFQNYLAEANALSGDYKGAYFNYKSYQEIKDSVYSQANKNKIAEAMSKFEIDKKNSEIAFDKLTIASQRKQKIFFVSGLFLISIIGGLLYWQSLTRKKTNTTLLKLNTELNEANKVKARFFGILSHDLRSPVANLVNFLQLQKRKPGIMNEEQKAERENKISDSAKSLLDTMEAMLLWSKGQMEHFKPTISAVPVNDLFEYIKKFFANTTNIAFTFSGDTNLVVQTDRQYLQTIMHNLTANAVKAIGQETNAHIEWKAWQEQNNIYLSVTDNGPGVKDEQLRALYDEKTSSGAISGLGLHIIRDLAKAIGCVISLNSQMKTGAEFVLVIRSAGNI
ncbi:MAG: tetratricopeptide repeat-containing sensor histidine kinase [Bacteroidota bacterium]|nr:tetratricopeptide repeat-containing sensor histidine kinase [Bacteroidota bacterium]